MCVYVCHGDYSRNEKIIKDSLLCDRYLDCRVRKILP